MRAMVVKGPKQGLALEERPLPRPGRGQVRVKVAACGICHSDKFAVEGLWPGLTFPRTPGHEVAGVVDAVGEGVERVRVGDRVGVGWHGHHDGTCAACLAGDYHHCRNARITGLTTDGGYADSMIASEVALALVPREIDFAQAAPLLCAGVTTFNALRNSGARPGDLVAVQGLGGLGHLGVQYAAAMGFEVAGVSRGKDKERFARELGAHHYLDTASEDAAARLQALGGAKVILATAPHAASISALVPGLGHGGALMVVGAPFEPLSVSAIDLISRSARVQGWASGTATDSTDALAFAARHGVRAMVETWPLEAAGTAYKKAMEGSVRFRAVLAMA
jgi:D-arabinose 1-dehydrogenase-like Zn-dependent alcohol dehydrogenase